MPGKEQKNQPSQNNQQPRGRRRRRLKQVLSATFPENFARFFGSSTSTDTDTSTSPAATQALKRTNSAPESNQSAASSSSSPSPRSAKASLLEVPQYNSPQMQNFIKKCPTEAYEKREFIKSFIRVYPNKILKTLLNDIMTYRIKRAGEGVSLLRGNSVDERLALAIMQHLLFNDNTKNNSDTVSQAKITSSQRSNETGKPTDKIEVINPKDIQIIKHSEGKKTPDIKELHRLLANLPPVVISYLHQIYHCFHQLNIKKGHPNSSKTALKELTNFLLFHIILPKFIHLTEKMSSDEKSANIQLKKLFALHAKQSDEETTILAELIFDPREFILQTRQAKACVSIPNKTELEKFKIDDILSRKSISPQIDIEKLNECLKSLPNESKKFLGNIFEDISSEAVARKETPYRQLAAKRTLDIFLVYIFTPYILDTDDMLSNDNTENFSQYYEALMSFLKTQHVPLEQSSKAASSKYMHSDSTSYTEKMNHSLDGLVAVFEDVIKPTAAIPQNLSR